MEEDSSTFKILSDKSIEKRLLEGLDADVRTILELILNKQVSI